MGWRSLRVVVVLLLLPAAGAACGTRSAAPRAAAAPARTGRESRPADRTTPEPGVRVQIIQAGRAPRKALRYQFRRDHLGVMSTVFDMDMSYRIGSGGAFHTPSPPMAMDMEVTGLTVTGGIARQTFRVSRFDVTTSPSDATDEKTRQAYNQSLAVMVGMTGWIEMDDRGRLRAMRYDIPPSLPAASRAILEGMSQSGAELVVPLPEEPVGAGAEWYVVKETPLMGIALTQSTRVRLVAVDGDRATLSYTVDIGAGNQPFALPGLPAGTTAELMSCDGSGGADIELDLGWLSPTRMNVHAQNVMNIELTTGAEKQQVEVQVRMSMEVVRR